MIVSMIVLYVSHEKKLDVFEMIDRREMPKRAVTGRVNLLPEGNDWSPRGLLTLIRPNPEIRGSRRSDAWRKCHR